MGEFVDIFFALSAYFPCHTIILYFRKKNLDKNLKQNFKQNLDQHLYHHLVKDVNCASRQILTHLNHMNNHVTIPHQSNQLKPVHT